MEQRLLDEEERKALRVYQEYKKLWSIIEKTQAIDDSLLPKDLRGAIKQGKKVEKKLGLIYSRG